MTSLNFICECVLKAKQPLATQEVWIIANIINTIPNNFVQNISEMSADVGRFALELPGKVAGCLIGLEHSSPP